MHAVLTCTCVSAVTTAVIDLENSKHIAFLYPYNVQQYDWEAYMGRCAHTITARDFT